MTDLDSINAALELGDRRAADVLSFRAAQLARREAVLQDARPERMTFGSEAEISPEIVAAAGPVGRGALVAEGDSWFDYPMTDVLRILEDVHGYDVDSVAHKGDRIEEMAYTGGQLEELTRTVEKLLRRRVVPRAILLSGGGNDVSGDEFGMLLNHRESPAPGFNVGMLEGLFGDRLTLAYVSILRAVTRVCEAKLQRRIPIVVHGYDHPVPDGRGFIGGWWFLPGPWLEPGFREKGYAAVEERVVLAAVLIDRFNAMLQRIAAMAEFDHVRYVDLRGTLSNAAGDYAEFWANELHPTPKGFELVANRLAQALQT